MTTRATPPPGPTGNEADIGRNTMGRKPIGDPVTIILATDQWNHIKKVAATFGPQRQGALVRAATRRLVHESNPGMRVRDYLDSTAPAPESFTAMNSNINDDLMGQLEQLGAAVGISRDAVLRVAIARLLADPSNLACELRPESWQKPTVQRTLKVRPDHRVELDELLRPYGGRLRSAAVRVAAKRLIAEPQHLLRDHQRHEQTRPLLPIELTQTRVAFDQELRERATALAADLGVSRSVLVRAAVDQTLHDQEGLEDEIIAETYQDGPRREERIRAHRRRHGAVT